MILLRLRRLRPDFEIPAVAGAAGKAQSVPSEHLAVLELAGRADRAREPRLHAAAGDFLHYGAQLIGRESALASISRVRDPHHVVHRLAAVGEPANVRVE